MTVVLSALSHWSVVTNFKDLITLFFLNSLVVALFPLHSFPWISDDLLGVLPPLDNLHTYNTKTSVDSDMIHSLQNDVTFLTMSQTSSSLCLFTVLSLFVYSYITIFSPQLFTQTLPLNIILALNFLSLPSRGPPTFMFIYVFFYHFSFFSRFLGALFLLLCLRACFFAPSPSMLLC